MALLRHTHKLVNYKWPYSTRRFLIGSGADTNRNGNILKMHRRLYSNCLSMNSKRILDKNKTIFSFSPNIDNIDNYVIKRYTCKKTNTGSTLLGSDDCAGMKQAVKDCHRVVEKVKCKELELPEWSEKDCKKICVPCCRPTYAQNECRVIITKENKCKGIKYKYHSFAHSAKKIPFTKERVSDCCYWDECCRRTDVGKIAKLLPIRERQRLVLGYKKNIYDQNVRNFTTTTSVNNEHDCRSKAALPCLKYDETALKRMMIKSRKACDRMCMPCCRPAREPPACYSPYIKPKCVKKKAPRLSFSECQDILKIENPCECLLPVEVCKRHSKDEDVGCHRR